jgi:hypothetical protein
LHLDHLSAGISVIPNQIPEGADAGWGKNQSPDVNSSRAFRRISQSNPNKASQRSNTAYLFVDLLCFDRTCADGSSLEGEANL